MDDRVHVPTETMSNLSRRDTRNLEGNSCRGTCRVSVDNGRIFTNKMTCRVDMQKGGSEMGHVVGVCKEGRANVAWVAEYRVRVSVGTVRAMARLMIRVAAQIGQSQSWEETSVLPCDEGLGALIEAEEYSH